jgi:hypothetical protein
LLARHVATLLVATSLRVYAAGRRHPGHPLDGRDQRAGPWLARHHAPVPGARRRLSEVKQAASVLEAIELESLRARRDPVPPGGHHRTKLTLPADVRCRPLRFELQIFMTTPAGTLVHRGATTFAAIAPCERTRSARWSSRRSAAPAVQSR